MVFCMDRTQLRKNEKENKLKKENKSNSRSNDVETPYTRHLKRKKMPR